MWADVASHGSPATIDHALFVLIALVYPLYWKTTWQSRVRSELASATTSVRVAAYRTGLIGEWLVAGAVLIWWLVARRAAADLGFTVSGRWPFWIGAGVVLAYATVGMRQIMAIRASAESRTKVRRQLHGDVALIIPRTAPERRMFTALSLTAGFCEEVAYRGFLMWYLLLFLPMPVVLVLSSAIFGFAHIYLGWWHVLRTGIVGLLLAAAYLLTGSLWVPIALHAVIDIVSGFAGSAAFEEDAAPAAS